jgi:branched-chain amino acid aminotransferase
LPGITRATVLDICKELEIPVEEKQITTEEISQADAGFFCGTAAEIIGFESLDNVVFPKRWEDSLSFIIKKAYSSKVLEKEFQLQETTV